jgi:hypothetical protein
MYPVATLNVFDYQRTIMFGLVSSHADAMRYSGDPSFTPIKN